MIITSDMFARGVHKIVVSFDDRMSAVRACDRVEGQNSEGTGVWRAKHEAVPLFSVRGEADRRQVSRDDTDRRTR